MQTSTLDPADSSVSKATTVLSYKRQDTTSDAKFRIYPQYNTGWVTHGTRLYSWSLSNPSSSGIVWNGAQVSGGSSMQFTDFFVDAQGRFTGISQNPAATGTQSIIQYCTGTVSSTCDSNALSTTTQCWSLFLHPTNGFMYMGCTGAVIKNPQDNKGSSFSSGQVQTFMIGAGAYTCGVLYPAGNTLYLGSSVGLGVEMDLSTMALLRIFFVLASSGLSPLRSVYLDTSGSLPATFWSTSDGYVARVNLRDFNVFSITSTPWRTDNLRASLYSNSTGLLYYGAAYNTSTTNSFRTFYATKTNCSLYSCQDCYTLDKEYCGVCLDTGLCTLQSSCPAGSWSQTGVCPAAISLSPTSGSSAGGTSVVYTGTYFDTSHINVHTCVWSNSTYSTTTTPTSVTATTVTCTAPLWAKADNISLSINWNTRQWSSALPYTYYDCSSFSCDTCITYAECGWCFRQSTCTAAPGSPSSPGRCPFSGSFDYQPSTCPSASTISPTSVPISGGTAVTVAVQNMVSGLSYFCNFGQPFGSSPGTPVLSGGDLTGITCNFPTSTYNATILQPVQITDSTGNLVYATSSSRLEAYNCTSFSRCFECSSAAHSACTWCSNSVCAFSSDIGSCSDPGTACATLTKVSPTSASISGASSLRVDITGARLQSGPISLLNCFWQQSSSTITTAVTIINDTAAFCSTPASMAAEKWTLGLGDATTVQTNDLSFLVYTCTAQKSCLSCTNPDFPACNWCLDIATSTCSDTHATSCNNWLDSASLCPSIVGSNPAILPVNGSIDLFLQGKNYLSPTNISQVSCAFNILGNNYYTNAVYVNDSTVKCDQAPYSSQATSASVSLIGPGPSNTTYSNSVSISYVSCAQFSDCASCITGKDFCHWCGATCTPSCPSELSVSACPFFTSVTPNYSDTTGGEHLVIEGGNFLVTSAKRDDDWEFGWLENGEDYSDDVDVSSTEKEPQIKSLLKSYAQQHRKKKREVYASPYACDWGGGITTAATGEPTGTKLFCDTPTRGGATRASLSITYQGLPYLTTSGIDYFSCQNTLLIDYCTESCTAASPYCGWCVSDATCQGQTQCITQTATASTPWQSGSCVTVTLNSTTAPIQGGIPITATLSSPVPTNLFNNAADCVFGTVTSPAILTSTIANSSVSTLTCMVPSVTSPIETTFTIEFLSKKYVAPMPFSYIDCSVHSTCAQCNSVPNCGWCSKNSKCTMSVQCGSTWSKIKCPINKIAVGVGVGLGLAVLLALLGLVLFLLRRAQRKRGLIIVLTEPNYTEVAFGADLEPQWRFPEHSWKVLNIALSRRDFVLQIAMASSCPSTEQEAMSKALVYVASAHGLAAELIQACIRVEVEACKAENTLFRHNSVVSKMYKFYCRIVGIKYLFNCLARVILELETFGRQQTTKNRVKSDDASLLSVSMELDQTKAIDTDDLDTETNLLQLQLICQKILNVIIKSSLRNIPAPFRKIFIEIDTRISSKYPTSQDAIYKGIGGLFFLRFVCPALTAPHVYGLLQEPPNTTTQRQLVLIGKVIQSIANLQPPGKKEQYMEALTPFITNSIPKIITFYDNLRAAVNVAQADTADDDDAVVDLTPTVHLNGLAGAWTFLHRYHPKVTEWVNSDSCKFDAIEKADVEATIKECVSTYTSAPKKVKEGSASDGGNKKKKRNQAANTDE